MFSDSKYSKFLTVLLIIVIVAIVCLVGFLGFDAYQKYFIEKDSKDFLESFEQEVGSKVSKIEDLNNQTTNTTDISGLLNQINTTSPENQSQSSNTSTTTKKPKQYKGFDVAGRIEIPKTKVDYPILTTAGNREIKVAVGIQYGVWPNEPGNTVIAGHNYRNGLFFSNNKKLNVGDIIYITDNAGVKLKYTIYNKYETTPEDTDYMVRNIEPGQREISLTTCTDDSKARLILWAKAE